MSELKRCPFCGIPLKLVGSKRRGNQHYLHEYNNNCILNGFGFTATDENIQHWNTRKPMQNIVERLEQQARQYNRRALEVVNKSTEAGIHNKGKACSYEHAIEIVKEEGGIDGSNL